MLDSLLDSAVVLLPIALSTVGVIVSIKIPKEKHRIWWIVSFIAFGVILSVLTYIQQSRTRTEYNRQQVEQAKQQKDLKDMLEKSGIALTQSRLAQEYMKGQLDSLSLLAGKISQSVSDPGIKQVAGAIEKLVQSNVQTIVASNKQICSNTFNLAKRMQKFEQERMSKSSRRMEQEWNAMRTAKTDEEKHHIWNQYIAQSIQNSANEQYEFRTTLLGEAIYLKDELLKRLPSEPQPSRMEAIAFEGSLAGPYPVSNAAVYLEKLARKLCP